MAASLRIEGQKNEELLNIMHGYGINSPQNLADTIEDICEGRLTCTTVYGAMD